MTVKELRNQLEGMPDSAEVFTNSRGEMFWLQYADSTSDEYGHPIVRLRFSYL